jgi:PPOX class probable F420-dependent enzyme
MGVALSAAFQQILKDRSYGHLATIMPDGSPQLTLVWVDTDGRYVLVNTVDGNQKVNNLRRDDRVAMTVSSLAHPASHVQLRGRVVEITSEARAATSRRYRRSTTAARIRYIISVRG